MKTQENNSQISSVYIIFFQYGTSYHSFVRVFVILQMLTYNKVLSCYDLPSFRYVFWVNIQLFVKICDFGDHFAFSKRTMRDRVMKN